MKLNQTQKTNRRQRVSEIESLCRKLILDFQQTNDVCQQQLIGAHAHLFVAGIEAELYENDPLVTK